MKRQSEPCLPTSFVASVEFIVFDPDGIGSSHHSDTDMVDSTLHTVFAHCSSTPNAHQRPVETVAERIMSLVERTDGEEINELKSLRDMLKLTVSSLPAAPVKFACAQTKFDLNVVQMEVEG